MHLLDSLRAGALSCATILHFDPFAFVMAEKDRATRAVYRDLVTQCGIRVRNGTLAAVSVFFTWGRNSDAATEDLEGFGYRGGIPGGFQDLVGAVSEAQRIVLKWCWEYYFAMLFIVPVQFRSAIAAALDADTRWLRTAMSRIEILA